MKAKFKTKFKEKKILRFEFYKQFDYRLNRNRVHGFIWIEDYEMIHVRFGQFHVINELGQVSGMVLKTNPGYNQIKRMIARWFQTYRTSRKSIFRDRISTLRDAC